MKPHLSLWTSSLSVAHSSLISNNRGSQARTDKPDTASDPRWRISAPFAPSVPPGCFSGETPLPPCLTCRRHFIRWQEELELCCIHPPSKTESKHASSLQAPASSRLWDWAG